MSKLLLLICTLQTLALASDTIITLEQAVKLSLEKNLDIKLSNLSSQEKEGAFTKAYGDFDFNLSGTYNLNDTRTPSSSNLDGVSASSFLFTRTRTYSLTLKKKFSLGTELQLPYSYPITGSNSTFQRIPLTHSPSLKLKVTQPLTQLFSLGYFEKKLDEAQYDLKIANSKHEDKINSTLSKTLELYLDTHKEKETARIKEATYLISKETLEFVKAKQKIGRSSLLDLLDAESTLQRNYESWLNSKITYQNKKEELAVQINTESDAELKLDDPLKSTSRLDSYPNLDEMILKALQKRPEASSSALSLEKAEVTKSAASIDRFPKLSVKGDISYSALNEGFKSSHDELTQRKFPSWSAEIDLEHPLFMYASRGAFQIAELKHKQEELKRLQTERDIALEIRKHFRLLQMNWERIEAYEKVIDSEKEKYKGEEARFKAGKISVYDFNLSMNSLKSAELDLIKAKTDYHKTIYKLAEARGLLLEELGLMH